MAMALSYLPRKVRYSSSLILVLLPWAILFFSQDSLVKYSNGWSHDLRVDAAYCIGALIEAVLFLSVTCSIYRFLRKIEVGPFYPMLLYTMLVTFSVGAGRLANAIAVPNHAIWVTVISAWLPIYPLALLAHSLYSNRKHLYSIGTMASKWMGAEGTNDA